MGTVATPDPRTAARVLVVEDDGLIARLIERVLQSDGCQIEHVSDGVEGLTRIAAGDLDLVLLDLTLPGLGGLELCRRARLAAPPDDAYLPILMVTAMARPAERRAGFAVGADDYIAKPFDPIELLARVQVWLRVRSQSKAHRAALLELQAADRKAMEARLEGVLLTAREMADLLINDLQAPLGTLELVRAETAMPAHARQLLDGASQSLVQAAHRLKQLQHVVRVAVHETPMGPALDLERSTDTAPAP